jgi:hypothetical protein
MPIDTFGRLNEFGRIATRCDTTGAQLPDLCLPRRPLLYGGSNESGP